MTTVIMIITKNNITSYYLVKQKRFFELTIVFDWINQILLTKKFFRFNQIFFWVYLNISNHLAEPPIGLQIMLNNLPGLFIITLNKL